MVKIFAGLFLQRKDSFSLFLYFVTERQFVQQGLVSCSTSCHGVMTDGERDVLEINDFEEEH